MTLAIAYYNTGAECEYLKRYSEAIKHYKNGFDLCKKNFGEEDQMTKNMKKSHTQATRKLWMTYKQESILMKSRWEARMMSSSKLDHSETASVSFSVVRSEKFGNRSNRSDISTQDDWLIPWLHNNSNIEQKNKAIIRRIRKKTIQGKGRQKTKKNLSQLQPYTKMNESLTPKKSKLSFQKKREKSLHNKTSMHSWERPKHWSNMSAFIQHPSSYRWSNARNNKTSQTV